MAASARTSPEDDAPARPASMETIHGIAVSPGIAIGPVLVLDARGLRLPARRIGREAVEQELKRLDLGLQAALREAEQAEAEAHSRLGPQYAEILAAHARMIADPTLRTEAGARIERDQIAAVHAVREVLEEHAARLERMSDSYLAARAADVRDIEARILGQLIGVRPNSFQDELASPVLIFAVDLTPSEAACLDRAKILGFATESGGQASHTSVVAAALEIPAVVGLGRFLPTARKCRTAIIDGDEGLVILEPDEATQERYRAAAAERSARFQVLSGQADLPAETRDGTAIKLWGNIEFIDEVQTCRKLGATGVGLFRTEFLFLSAASVPSEEQQFDVYAAVVRSLEGRPIIIRTLDLGSDKLRGQAIPVEPESNPALGLRSLRLLLREPGLFRPHLRAILRASSLGDVRVMFPMVTSLAELRRARALVREVAAELASEGHRVRDDLPVGIMVEVPAAALTADLLAKEVDFFSIGTNDLTQYTLAVDRTNETVAGLYSAADPSVLRLINMVIQAAGARGIEVSVCGTMGGEPLCTMLLLGLGLRQLSMPPHQLPEIRRVIREVRIDQARAVAAEALRLETAQDVTVLLQTALRQAVPENVGPASAPPSATVPVDRPR
jgi:phosphotransferase system enzyme I (PtsI)